MLNMIRKFVAPDAAIPGVVRNIRVLQLLPVHHNQVVGKRIQAVIQAFFAGLVQFLRGKRDKNCRAAGGQPSLNLDLAICQRQATHQPLLLLVVQSAQIAVVLLGNGAGLKDVVFQFLFRAPDVQHQKGNKEHPLVLALQFLQQGFCINYRFILRIASVRVLYSMVSE